MARDRLRDFNEISSEFSEPHARQQASRCSQCGVPFCQIHCPLGNNIPDWLNMTAQGRLREAYELSQATNTFPEICGRICPQDRLCEGNCVIERGFASVTIGSIEKYITETAFSQGWVKAPKPTRARSEHVGIIGSGPAGLAAASRLRESGYDVSLYDRHDRAGGLLTYGIPNFKLEKQVVFRRIQLLREAGIHFHLQTDIGRAISFKDLRARHDALLIATGVYRAKESNIAKSKLSGIVPAMEYLVSANRHGLGDRVPAFESGEVNAAGKNVVVIGGGDTAMDCVRTAKRQGAKTVTCIYRRDQAAMPGSTREVAHAQEEGVQFMWLTTPKSYIGPGRVNVIRAVKTRLHAPHDGGRATFQELPNSEFTLDADMVIEALGYDPEDIPTLFDEPGLEISPSGTMMVEETTQMTSLPGVFAAGDIVRGASLVVWAIKDGQDAAAAIDRYIESNQRQPLRAAE